MVDFARLKMADTVESLSAQVSALGTSMDERFETIEKRVEDGFAAVDEHFAEQRAYTEFGYERLERAMVERFDAMDGRFDAMDGRFDAMGGRFDAMNGRFDRLERKLDQFIESQLQTNLLVDRRLRALERPDRRRRQ
jgi:hypothetical protein